MKYILYGTTTSPFVRRIRLLLGDLPYDLKEINPYDEQGGSELNKINPINQIPVLVDGKNVIWDSRQIFNYLNSIHKFQEMTLDDENLLTVIDGMMSAGVTLMQLKRSGLEAHSDFFLNTRSRERMESTLNYLKPFLLSDKSSQWNFHTMSIISFLEWAIFREIISINNYPECISFLARHNSHKLVQLTKISQ